MTPRSPRRDVDAAAAPFASARRGALLALLGTAAVACAYAAVARSAVDWSVFTPAYCVAAGAQCFCEAPRAGAAIRQPADTWSTLAYVAVGLFVLGAGARPRDAPRASAAAVTPEHPAFRAAYGALVAALGPASAMLHATLTRWGSWADLLSMYAFASFVVAFEIARAAGLRWRAVLLGSVAPTAACLALLATAPRLRREAFGVLMVALAAAVVRPRRADRSRAARGWLAGAAGALVAALVLWVLDQRPAFCAPWSPWQGHAAWHALTALAAGMLFAALHLEGAAPPLA